MSSQLCSMTKWPALCVAPWKGRMPLAASLPTFTALLNFPVLYVCVCVQLMRDQLQQEEQRERQQQLQLQQNAAQQYMQCRMARPHAPTAAISTPQHYQSMQVPVEVLKVSRAAATHQTMFFLIILGWMFNNKDTEFSMKTENAIWKMKAVFFFF